MLCFRSTQYNSTSFLRTHTIESRLLLKTMMIGGTRTSSSSKIIRDNFPVRRGGSGAEIFTCVPRNTFHHKLLRLNYVHGRMIPLRSSSIKVNIEEGESVEKSPEKKVRVRFQLRKECVFGDHLFIVGDDPVFGGLWDPENALPLNWSDGHVWTLDLDLPVGRLVEFKFILKAKTGDILWQPGPNRAIETWETNKTIRICEDWENSDLQMMMMEEDFVPLSQEVRQSSVILDMPKQSESVTLLANASSNGAGEEEVEAAQQISSVVVVEDAGYLSDESEENSSSYIQSGKPIEHSNGPLTACDEHEAMFTEEDSPILVPGLFPVSDLENEQASSHASVEVNSEGKAETFPEVDKRQETKGERNEKERVKAVSVFEKSEQQVVKDVEKGHYNAAEEEVQKRPEAEALGTPHVLLEKDIQWGRRKLYKLLSNFGLF